MKKSLADRSVRSARGRKRSALASVIALLLTAGVGSIFSVEDDPIYLSAEVNPPERTLFVGPVYPEAAKKDHIEGKVVLEIVVGRSGEVEDVRIIKSNPAFDPEAVKAASQWKYRPALREGKPVRVYMTVVVEFSVKGRPEEEPPIYLTSDVKPPERAVFVKPEYPEEAKKDRREGKVTLEIVVNRAGDVEDVRVLKSDPVFDDAAILAVREWKYKPALREGKAVKVYLTVIMDFDLK